MINFDSGYMRLRPDRAKWLRRFQPKTHLQSFHKS